MAQHEGSSPGTRDLGATAAWYVSAELLLPNNPRSAIRARHAIDELDSDAHPETLARARLLVTELVAAGITDTASAKIKLILTAFPGGLRAELAMGSEAPSRPSGWGLFLMNRIADHWGVSQPGNVWFEVVDKAQRRFMRGAAQAPAEALERGRNRAIRRESRA